MSQKKNPKTFNTHHNGMHYVPLQTYARGSDIVLIKAVEPDDEADVALIL